MKEEVKVVTLSLPQCGVCGRMYPTEENALACRTFKQTYSDWECRSPRGSDKWQTLVMMKMNVQCVGKVKQ